MPRSSSTRQTTPRQRVIPVQQRSRLKIEAILDATAVLLGERGLEAVSMLAIAEQASLPPATVYHYFESRLAVFAALVERTMAQVDADLERHIERFAASQEASAGPLLNHLHAAYRQAPGYVQVLQTLRAEPALRDIIRASNQRIAGVLTAVLAQRTALHAERAARVAWILSESCEQVLQEALVAPPETAEALMQELVVIVDALFRHYLTEEGA